jgi:hypothetical protein
LSLNPRIRMLESEISERMETYRTKPKWLVEYGSGHIGTAHVWEQGASPEEGQALQHLEDIMNAGKLVARCSRCQTWFYRDKRTDKYCSDKCRIEQEESKKWRKEGKKLNSKRGYWQDEYRWWYEQWRNASGERKRMCASRMHKAKQKLAEVQSELDQRGRKV